MLGDSKEINFFEGLDEQYLTFWKDKFEHRLAGIERERNTLRKHLAQIDVEMGKNG